MYITESSHCYLHTQHYEYITPTQLGSITPYTVRSQMSPRTVFHSHVDCHREKGPESRRYDLQTASNDSYGDFRYAHVHNMSTRRRRCRIRWIRQCSSVLWTHRYIHDTSLMTLVSSSPTVVSFFHAVRSRVLYCARSALF